jgi:hypothetical protein
MRPLQSFRPFLSSLDPSVERIQLVLKILEVRSSDKFSFKPIATKEGDSPLIDLLLELFHVHSLSLVQSGVGITQDFPFGGCLVDLVELRDAASGRGLAGVPGRMGILGRFSSLPGYRSSGIRSGRFNGS